MKHVIKNSLLLVTLFTMVILSGCSNNETTPTPKPEPPGTLPETPPPATLPTVISTVADVKSGKFSKGEEIFLYGYLTRQKSDDADEWYFTDDGGATELILDFPTSQLPAVDQKMLVYGGVDDIGEVDVIGWWPTDTPPTTPTPPDFPPPGVTPPALVITTVDDIVKGVKTGEVIMAGQLTHQQDDDCDEWIFNDGTGSLEMEFQSCNVPAVGTPVYIWGKTDGQYEIDVFSWDPQ
jgi:uncharacterized protein YdeI (BOF family)